MAEQQGTWKHLAPQTSLAYQAALGRLGDTSPQETILDPAAFEAIQQVLAAVLTSTKDIAQTLADQQQRLNEQRSIAQRESPTVVSIAPVAVATPPPAPAQTTATITFLSLPNTIPDLTRLSQSFQEQQPNITVNIISTDVLTDAPSLRLFAQSSDCFLWRGVPETPADAAAVLDIQPLLNADATLPVSDYPSMLLAPYSTQQHLLGLPYAFRLHTMSYNKELFTAANTVLPDVTWTPDQFLVAATSLTNEVRGQHVYGYAPLLDPGMDLAFFVRQFGGHLANGSNLEAQPNFTDPTVVRAIQWYLDLYAVHHVMPKPVFTYKQNTYFGTETQDLVQQGRVGMWFTWGLQTPEPQGYTLGSAPLPIGRGGLASTDVRTQALFISAHSQNIAACWSWLSFLSSKPIDGGASIPARQSIADSSIWSSQALTDTKALYQTYRKAIIDGQSGQEMNSLRTIDWYWFYDALTQVVEQHADLATALGQAQQRTSAFMDCLRSQNKAMTCAVKVDPQYQGYNLESPPVPGGG